VDLGDHEKRIAFQVTSDSSKAKVVKTLKRFDDHEISKDFDKLQVVVITIKKSKIKDVLSLKCGIPFDKDKDVIDLSELNKTILGFDVGKQEIVLEFLRDEFEDSLSRAKQSTEVGTLIDLVDYLTKNKNLPTGDWEEEPDPEKKIKQRFSQHSEYLEKEILRLLPSVDRTKVFIYDMALMINSHTKVRHPLFLIHDNIFDVDQDTLVESLNYLAERETDGIDFQYILTLNDCNIFFRKISYDILC
jgi:hypothetical protein